MIKNLLCFIGFHDWRFTYHTPDWIGWCCPARKCVRCERAVYCLVVDDADDPKWDEKYKRLEGRL